MTQEEIEKLVARTIKEQKGRVMPRLRDRAPYPFTLEILAITVTTHIQSPRIECYRGKGDLIEHV